MLQSSDLSVPLGAWWEQGLPQRHPAWSRAGLPMLETACLLRLPTPDDQWDPVSAQILVRGGSLSVPELTEGRSLGKQAGHSFGVKDLHGIWGSGFPGLGKELPK